DADGAHDAAAHAGAVQAAEQADEEERQEGGFEHPWTDLQDGIDAGSPRGLASISVEAGADGAQVAPPGRRHGDPFAVDFDHARLDPGLECPDLGREVRIEVYQVGDLDRFARHPAGRAQAVDHRAPHEVVRVQLDAPG